MKTVMKSLVVGLVVFTLSFSPALMGMAQAGGVNFEGISAITTDDTVSYENQPRGLMLNFSFGGPKDYKKTKSLVAMMNDTGRNRAIFAGVAVGAVILALIVLNDDDNDPVKECGIVRCGSVNPG